MHKIIYRLFFAALILVFALSWTSRYFSKTKHIPSPETSSPFLHMVAQADHVTIPSQKNIHQIFNDKNLLLGYGLLSHDFVRNIQGYGGPIHLAIAIDPQGKILAIEVIKHQETPQLLKKLPEFMAQFRGLKADSGLKISKNIDGISGATMTSQAIVQTIMATVNAALAQIPSLQAETHTPSVAGLSLHSVFSAVIILILFALSVYACCTRKTFWRWTALTAGFLFLGLSTRFMLSSSHLAQLALGNPPGPLEHPQWYVLIIGTILTSLALGRVYCSGVCPFGFVEEILFKINQKSLNRPLSPSERTDAVCRWFKYIFLLFLLALCIFWENTSLAGAEVYTYLFSGQTNLSGWALVTIILFASFFYLRFWCRYLCPFGAFVALLSQFRFKKYPAAQGTGAVCAEAAECFHCDCCMRTRVKHSSRFQNLFFIVFMALGIICLAVQLQNNITAIRASEAISPVSPVETRSDPEINTAPIKTQFKKAGIIPHPAKHWRMLPDG